MIHLLCEVDIGVDVTSIAFKSTFPAHMSVGGPLCQDLSKEEQISGGSDPGQGSAQVIDPPLHIFLQNIDT